MDVWVLMSGGIDSTACAHYYLERDDSVTGVFVDYGQKAREAEYQAVLAVAKYFRITLKTITVSSSGRFGAGEIQGRNALLIFAALVSENPKRGLFSLGIHAGTRYYDCGIDFVRHANLMIESYSGGKVVLDCPFISADKSAVYSYAKGGGVPLALTYSCEEGAVPPCGHCLSCRDRDALSTR